jgi:ribonuclease-3
MATIKYSPYNSRNQVFTQTDIHSILRKHNCNHNVKNTSHFQTAMVHSSYIRRTDYTTPTGEISELEECPDGVMNLFENTYERLEHLGDSVLGACVASYLCIRFPNEQEGFLTTLRKEIVCNSTLGLLTQKIGLNKFYVISKHNEDICNGRENVNKLGDILEAFIGALWVDSSMNFQTVYTFVCALIEKYIDIPKLLIHDTNFKDQLQKLCQTKFKYTPKYIEVECVKNMYKMAAIDVHGNHIGIGTGNVKKQAEQMAAKCALQKFGVKL